MPRVADAEGVASSFAFALPAQPEWAGELARITLSGPGGSATLDADGERSAVLARDSATGQVRGIYRDLPPETVAEALAFDPGLEVLVSRGIPAAPDWNR